MNKYAAEKIAQEYYSLGVKLAMEKIANPLLADAVKGLRGLAKGSGKASKVVRSGVSHARPIGPHQFTGMHGRPGAFNLAEFNAMQAAPTGGRARGLSRVPAPQYNDIVQNLSGPNALEYLKGNPQVQGYLDAGFARSGLGGMTPKEMLSQLPKKIGR